MSSEQFAIRADSVAKRYEVYARPEDRFKQFILPRLARATGRAPRSYFHEFWALRDVSLEVRRGETVGIIGRNGAGKSTLLQIIAGTLTPTLGTVEVNGRVSALLELGAGFNIEFSGRDNVFLYAALLGLTREEIEAKFADIHAFSGIGRFMDEPVKTYSSGMYARLAFSVAVHCEPAVLIVDEALSVGDMEFQERSITRMKEIRDSGTSILFVTHSVPTVRNFCERAVWLENGAVRMQGEAADICRAYVDDIESHLRKKAVVVQANGSKFPDDVPRHESGAAKTAYLRGATLDKPGYAVGEPITISLRLGFTDPKAEYGIGILIRNQAGKLVAVLNTIRDDIFLDKPVDEVTLSLPKPTLPPGTYFVTVSLCDRNAMFSYDLREECLTFEVTAEFNRFGLPRWEGQVALDHAWRC